MWQERIMRNRYRIALVGCGRISQRHIDVIRENNKLELVGVCDVVRSKAESKAISFGIKHFYNAIEMAKEIKPDIIAILTESGKHSSVGTSLVPYTKSLIIEKPISLTLDDADKLIDSCARQNVSIFVVKQNRYNRPVVMLRRAVESGRFGKLVLGTVRVRWCRTQEYYNQDKWRGTWKDDGGVFANQASHHIDLLQWMMGPTESVKAYTTTRLVNIETEDVGVAILRFASGALGIIEATTATRPRDLEGSISVLGEKGAVVISGFAVNKVETWNFADSTDDDMHFSEWSTNPPNVYGYGHSEFYKEVVECMDSGKKSMLDGIEGRKSLELINAIYEAAAGGAEVRLKYVPKNVLLGKGI
jgi:predicted dehydrogenase